MSAAEARVPEFAYTDADFRQIKGMLYDDAGIYLPDTKQNLVYSRLAKRLRALGLQTFEDYVDLVQGRSGRHERTRLINALTTNHTHFFREPHHFDTVREKIAHEAMEATSQGRRYRIWSAGCSTGEEPYSLAIALLEAAPELAERDIQILATDIDNEVIDRAQKGAYDKEVISPVQPILQQRFFETGWGPNSDKFVVGDELRKLITFRKLNLMQHWPMPHRFDMVICRNVVIYFDESTKTVLWDRFANHLNDGGWLFIGHSERIAGTPRARFEPAGLTTYKKIG